MTTFLLIRHALTDDVGRRITGWTPGVHLNAEGRAQAESLASRLAHLPVAAIYSSPLERTRETAAFIARNLNLEVQADEAFGEIRYGEWTGRTLAEMEDDAAWRRYNQFRSGTRIPGGEMMSETQARVVAGLEKLRERHDAELVAVVSHGDPINAAIMHYAGVSLDFFFRIEISPASVSIVRLEAYGPKILTVNDTGEIGRVVNSY